MIFSTPMGALHDAMGDRPTFFTISGIVLAALITLSCSSCMPAITVARNVPPARTNRSGSPKAHPHHFRGTSHDGRTESP